jgi:hypothetical protein
LRYQSFTDVKDNRLNRHNFPGACTEAFCVSPIAAVNFSSYLLPVPKTFFMRKARFLLVISVAFITAAAFKKMQENKFNASQSVRANIYKQKAFSIRCSPLYIPTGEELIPALTGWGNYSWKITTVSDSAQFYFDQGINMYYAFHIIESRASFEKATRFDSTCAMAWWGKALAFGPNINDFGYQRPSEAYPSMVKAKQLSSKCRPVEKDLINAMSMRYTGDTATDQSKLNVLYTNAMRMFTSLTAIMLM